MAGFEHRFGPVHLIAERAAYQISSCHNSYHRNHRKKNLWQFDNVSYRFRKREAEKRIEKEV